MCMLDGLRLPLPTCYKLYPACESRGHGCQSYVRTYRPPRSYGLDTIMCIVNPHLAATTLSPLLFLIAKPAAALQKDDRSVQLIPIIHAIYT